MAETEVVRKRNCYSKRTLCTANSPKRLHILLETEIKCYPPILGSNHEESHVRLLVFFAVNPRSHMEIEHNF